MKNLIEQLTVTEFMLSLLVILIYGILVIYWDAKRRRDKEKNRKKEIDFLLSMDESENFYHTDDREVEYDRAR